MDRHYFERKGKQAEEYIALLCSNAFQYDFCFKNPFIDNRELCDVLIILEDKAIIWQIKNLKEKKGFIKIKEVDKGIRQCIGAKRKLSNCDKIELINMRNEIKKINCRQIIQYYLVVVIEGSTPNNVNCIYNKNNCNINVFFPNFTRFALKYLNTIPDLVDYFNSKEVFLNNNSLSIKFNEEDILAYYLMHGRTFGSFLKTTNLDFSNLAHEFDDRDEVRVRLKEDKKYHELTDYIINKKRESILISGNVSSEYDYKDKQVSIFLNMNSLEKRAFGKLFLSCAFKANELKYSLKSRKKIMVLTDYYFNNGVLFIFDFLGDSSQKFVDIRRSHLKYVAYGSIKKIKNNFDYIIGIATELNFINNVTHSFEWIFIDYTNKKDLNEAIDINIPNLDKILKDLNILQAPKINTINENEYEATDLYEINL